MDEKRQFRLPWERLGDSASKLDIELRKELAPGHPLFGCEATAVARSVDSDDVLYAVSLPSTPWAVVHLTWRGLPEMDARWPDVQLLSDLNSLLEPPSNT